MWLAGAFGAVGLLSLVAAYLGRHPWVLAVVVLVVLAAAGGGGWLVRVRRDATQRRAAALTSSIAMADGLTGTQFEHWTAALMRRTGFGRVEVCGGAGDLGADIIAVGPGRCRVVAQCKCLRADRAVGSPDVQRFAGTARAVHRADIAVIVTTGRFSRPAVDAAARLGITLVDRRALAVWAADGVSPAALNRAR